MKNKNQKVELFDIHTHILPYVDDGSTSIESSLRMIKEEVDSGVKSIILTPHYRKYMFETEKQDIERIFNEFKETVNSNNIDVNLYLGREIYVSSSNDSFIRTLERINDGTVSSLNNSKFYLLEFSYDENIEISEITYSLNKRGLIGIVAHIERYNYIDNIEKVNEIKETGALIQVNASSIVGLDGGRVKKFVWNLIKNDLVDIVASDIHASRDNCLKEAYDLISKKISVEKANELFLYNPSKIIK